MQFSVHGIKIARNYVFIIKLRPKYLKNRHKLRIRVTSLPVTVISYIYIFYKQLVITNLQFKLERLKS